MGKPRLGPTTPGEEGCRLACVVTCSPNRGTILERLASAVLHPESSRSSGDGSVRGPTLRLGTKLGVGNKKIAPCPFGQLLEVLGFGFLYLRESNHESSKPDVRPGRPD